MLDEHRTLNQIEKLNGMTDRKQVQRVFRMLDTALINKSEEFDQLVKQKIAFKKI